MIVKKYKADTETAAILAAKEDLGPEAVVLNVKTMKQRGFARFFKHDYVEITAALEEKEFEQKVSSRRPAVNAAATKEIKPAEASSVMVPSTFPSSSIVSPLGPGPGSSSLLQDVKLTLLTMAAKAIAVKNTFFIIDD